MRRRPLRSGTSAWLCSEPIRLIATTTPALAPRGRQSLPRRGRDPRGERCQFSSNRRADPQSDRRNCIEDINPVKRPNTVQQRPGSKMFGSTLAAIFNAPKYHCAMNSTLGSPEFAVTRLQSGARPIEKAPIYPGDDALNIKCFAHKGSVMENVLRCTIWHCGLLVSLGKCPWKLKNK